MKPKTFITYCKETSNLDDKRKPMTPEAKEYWTNILKSIPADKAALKLHSRRVLSAMNKKFRDGKYHRVDENSGS